MKSRKKAAQVHQEMNYGFNMMMLRSILFIVLILVAVWTIKRLL